jgi:hypothetical protein
MSTVHCNEKNIFVIFVNIKASGKNLKKNWHLLASNTFCKKKNSVLLNWYAGQNFLG